MWYSIFFPSQSSSFYPSFFPIFSLSNSIYIFLGGLLALNLIRQTNEKMAKKRREEKTVKPEKF